MRIRTTKQALVECLGITGKAVSSRSSIQVLSGVLIDARTAAEASSDQGDATEKDAGGDRVLLSATDMEIYIGGPLAATVEQSGSLVVPSRIVSDIARTLPVGDVIIEQRVGETQLEIRAGESQFTLHSLPAADFPQLPRFTEEGFTIDKPAFLETVDRVAASASRDETRPVLTGVFIHLVKDSVRMVATDSYRLSVKETAVTSSVSDTLQAIVPARTLMELSRIAGAVADTTLTVVLGENQILFQVGGISLISRLIDGQFPEYRQLIPETFDHEIAIDRDELLDSIHRISLLAQKNAPLRLRFAENTLTISAEAQDVGKGQEAMPVQYAGEPLEIGFNPDFLEAGVATIKESPVYLRLISPLRPGLLKGAGDDFLYLVMPIRLND